MSKFTRALVVTPLADGKTWVLLTEFIYEVGDLGSGDLISVDIGFKTDFASVPRPLWWIFPRWGRYGNAAVLHDWLYWCQQRPRKAADLLFLEAMTVLNVPPIQKYPIFLAVRCFGIFAWWRNRWERGSGDQRVMSMAADEEIKSTLVSDRSGFLRSMLRKLSQRH